jgi:hypothetical protein
LGLGLRVSVPVALVLGSQLLLEQGVAAGGVRMGAEIVPEPEFG